jgi:hypothetical protein
VGAHYGELTEYLDPSLTLRIQGKDYEVPLPDAELGTWCRLMAPAAGQLHAASTDAEIADARKRIEDLPPPPGDDNLPFEQRLLGAAFHTMVADRVPDPFVKFAAMTVYVRTVSDDATAERFWYSGGRPEAVRPPANRADRRAAAKTGGSRTVAAKRTPSVASTSGTKSPRKSSASSAASRSPGKRS